MTKTPEQARIDAISGNLQALVQTPGWDTYIEEMAQMELRRLEIMFQGSKEDFDYNKGFIEGLRTAVEFPKRYKRS